MHLIILSVILSQLILGRYGPHVPKNKPSPLCLVACTHGGAVGNDAGLYRTSV